MAGSNPVGTTRAVADRPASRWTAFVDWVGSGYGRIVTATFISQTGVGMLATALPFIAAATTDSPAKIASVYVVDRLPWVAAAVSGTFADRHDRRKIALGADFVRGAMVAIGAILIATGHRTLPILWGIALVVSTATTFFETAAPSMLTAVVPPEKLEEANGRLGTAETWGLLFIGPVLGGLAVAHSAGLPLAIDAATFLASATLILGLRSRRRSSFRPPRVAGPLPSIRADLGDGIGWVWRTPLVRLLTLLVGALAFFQGGVSGLLVPYAKEQLDLGPSGYGLVMAASAIGSSIAGLMVGRINDRLGAAGSIALAVASNALAYLLLAGTDEPIFAGALLAIWSFGVVIGVSVIAALRQRHVPDELLGRVSGVSRTVAWGAIPAGAAIGGVVASATHIWVPFAAAGAAQLVLLALVIPVLTRRLREG